MSAWRGGNGSAEPGLFDQVHLLNDNAQSCTIIRRIWSGCGNLSIRCASLSNDFLSSSQKSEHFYMLDSILGDTGT